MKTTNLTCTTLFVASVILASCQNGRAVEGDDRVGARSSALTLVTCVGDANPAVDDSPAINAATASANEVVLPAGTCNIASVITLGTGVWLHGQGASTVLRAIANPAALIYGGAVNAKISDLTLDGNAHTSPGISFSAVQNLTLTRILLRNFTAQAISLSATTGANANVTISENVLQNVGHGIALSGTPSPVTFSKIIVTDNSIQPSSGEAIYLRGVRDVLVSGNILDTGTNAGIVVESGVSATSIANNLVRAGTSSAATGIAIGGGALDNDSDLAIGGNQVVGYGTGLTLVNTTSSSFSRVSIVDNVFTGISGSALRLSDGSDLLVSKNQLNGGTYGIDIPTGVRGIARLSMTGNLISGATARVNLNSATLTDVLLDSNTFSGTNAVQTPIAPAGRFEAASNMGWKGPSSGLHAGRNTSGTCTIQAGASFCGFPAGSVPEPTLDYRVVMTPTSSNVTNLAKQHVTSVAKANNGFTVTTETALTGTDSVQFDWVILRDPT